MTLILDTNDALAYEFYYVRHGESASNVAKLISGGGCNCLLTERGKAQAHLTGTVISTSLHKPSAIFYSPLARAQETAEIINQYLGLPIYACEYFQEQHLGDLEGRGDWQDLIVNFERRLDPPNGESYPDFYHRVYQGVKHISDREEAPLVISHGGVWHALKALVGDFKTHWPENASFHKVLISSASEESFRFKSEEIFSPDNGDG